jgi:hypothetical protein
MVQYLTTERGGMQGEAEYWAIEVKAARQVDARHLKGLGAFVECARKVA